MTSVLERQAETGKNTVPQIFVAWSTGRAEYIGGYDTLSEWCASLPLPLAAALNVASASAATTRLTRVLAVRRVSGTRVASSTRCSQKPVGQPRPDEAGLGNRTKYEL